MENSQRISARDIDDFIAHFPPEVQTILQNIRHIVKEVAPQAQEAIKYGIPTFVLLGKNLVHFAAFKCHIGFYPTPTGTEKFQQEIAPYHHSKGAIQFPLNQPIPYDLIRRIVAFRVQETQAQAAAKKKK